MQSKICAIDISGNPEYRVDSLETDFLRRVIELRESIKKRRNVASEDDRVALDTQQNALKLPRTRHAIAKPETMAADQFADRTSAVIDWFAALNPYGFCGSILKSEDVNASLDKGEPEPLCCWAVSSKRYALFSTASDGSPIMQKVSAHGL